jgi:hypothetical protein
MQGALDLALAQPLGLALLLAAVWALLTIARALNTATKETP